MFKLLCPILCGVFFGLCTILCGLTFLLPLLIPMPSALMLIMLLTLGGLMLNCLSMWEYCVTTTRTRIIKPSHVAATMCTIFIATYVLLYLAF